MQDTREQILLHLSQAVLSARRHKLNAVRNRPRCVQIDRYRFKKSEYKRIRIILQGNGCSVPLCTMCPMPNEGLNPKHTQIEAIDYIEQIDHAFSSNPHCEMVCIYNDGSFFSPKELPESARRQIYQIVSNYGCKYLIIESLPNFITQELLEESSQLLNGVKLIIGIGLHSISDEVRELCINCRFTLKSFYIAFTLMKEYGVNCKTYVMIKPPFLAEKEAIYDAAFSAIWLRKKGIEDVTLCPTRVVPGTLVQDMHNRGLYKPPMLTSIIKCLQLIHDCGEEVRLSLFNVQSPDIFGVTPTGCIKCEDRINAGLVEYNRNPKAIELDRLRCRDCEERAIEKERANQLGRNILDRVNNYLREIRGKEKKILGCQ